MEKPSTIEWNYGIDLLRLVAMAYVVALHVIGAGGALEASVPGSDQWLLLNFLWAWCRGAVDIFVLISGYVSYTENEMRVGLSRYLQLWLQIVFYGVVVFAVFGYLHPGAVSMEDYQKALTPVAHNAYWYFTAYTGLFFLMPLLNAALHHLSEKTLRKVFLALFAVFSVFDVCFNVFNQNFGYSVIWLMLLYCMGGIIKKCGIGSRIRPWMAAVGIILLITVSWLWKIREVTVNFLGVELNEKMLISYTSPTITAAAVLYVIAFSKLRFGDWMTGWISFAAPCAFAAYILNCHHIVWNNVMLDHFTDLATADLRTILLTVFLFPTIFLLASVLADRIRMLLFWILQIKRITLLLERGADAAAGWISSKL